MVNGPNFPVTPNTNRVVSKPGDVSLVASVKQNRASFLPLLAGHQVALLEGLVLCVVEMIELNKTWTEYLA